jgi:L-rhamnose mutarotase
MVLSTTDEFDFNQKAIDDKNNPKVQEWETLMWKYQEALPTAKPGEKWKLMKLIFQLSNV